MSNIIDLLDQCLHEDRNHKTAPPPILLYTAGPSGSGKNTVLEAAKQQRQSLATSISATTRKPRRKSGGSMELNGVDYHFMEYLEFKEAARRGLFMEFAEVHGNLYGTPWDSIEGPWSSGKSIVGDIDVQGVKALMLHNDPRVRRNLVTVFISAPSAEQMCARMKLRDASIGSEEIERRVETAKEEILSVNLFDHVIVNDVFEDAVAEFLDVVDLLTAVMEPEKRREIFRKLYWNRRQAIDYLKNRFDWNIHPKWAVQGSSAVVNP